MSLASAIVSFFIVWWATLFTVLPFGVRTQGEMGRVEPGTPESAPARPMLARKFLITTILAGLIWGAYCYAVTSGLLTLDALPFFDPTKS